jgi:hypothetical protein
VERSLADNSGYFVSGVAGALTAPRLCLWLSEPPTEYALAKYSAPTSCTWTMRRPRAPTAIDRPRKDTMRRKRERRCSSFRDSSNKRFERRGAKGLS